MIRIVVYPVALFAQQCLGYLVSAQPVLHQHHAGARRRLEDSLSSALLRPLADDRTDTLPLVFGMHVPRHIDAHVRFRVPQHGVAHEIAVRRDYDQRVGLQVEGGSLLVAANSVRLGSRFTDLLDGAGVQEVNDGFHIVQCCRATREMLG